MCPAVLFSFRAASIEKRGELKKNSSTGTVTATAVNFGKRNRVASPCDSGRLVCYSQTEAKKQRSGQFSNSSLV